MNLTPLSEIGARYAVNPITDLRPVCPNCHAVIHLGGCTRSIDEVREMLQSRAPGQMLEAGS
ncbi:5-methylcytosine-specific restriction enzyme A [Thiocapsa roseopersicina]|uniref:5-methylcytosine-specific restriction enzyme A n=1 Tax=Thiocapsa roseopersicina TaxID=1058 RepID=A0A1H2R305_THIRO|nr:5-methylcytosine-specific restriction enzyme A [Thiocapsa roseopersicina]